MRVPQERKWAPSDMIDVVDLDDRRLERAARLSAVVSEASGLPTTRPVLGQLLTVLSDPDADARDVAQVASTEPNVAAELVRVANSAYYGLSGKVSNVQFAVIVMGLGSVRAFVADALLRSISAPPVGREDSVLRAVAAGRLAEYAGADPSDAFCAALLADVGRDLLASVDPDGYLALNAAVEHPDDLELLETQWADTTHSEVAAALFSAWSFPQPLIDAVLAHHHREHVVPETPLSRTVRLAQDFVNRVRGFESREDVGAVTDNRLIEDDVPVLLQSIALEADDLGAILGRVS